MKSTNNVVFLALTLVAIASLTAAATTITTTAAYADQGLANRCLSDKDTGDYQCATITKDQCKDFADATDRKCVTPDKAPKESNKR